jgi:hypothetical protein
MLDGSRILFLDDNPIRAAAFLAARPEAVWVQTAEECVAHLAEPWDEVHLDHDLGGEVFVDHERDDCGMAVIRWICQQPRPHLRSTRFVIHSHNVNAACMMAMHLEVTGYDVQTCPFGSQPFSTGSPGTPQGQGPMEGGWIGRLSRFWRRRHATSK